MASISTTLTDRASQSNTVDELTQHLALANLVRITIGPIGSASFYIPRETMRAASHIFERAVDNARLTQPDPQQTWMIFPNEDLEACKLMLYWIMKRTLPPEDNADQVLLVKAWVLGEKYQVVEFQDLVMLELLAAIDSHSANFNAVEHAFWHTAPSTKIRILMAEELVKLACVSEAAHLPVLTSLQIVGRGLDSVLLAIREAFSFRGDGGLEYIFGTAKRTESGSEAWRRYMVGGGPGVDSGHWVHEAPWEEEW